MQIVNRFPITKTYQYFSNIGTLPTLGGTFSVASSYVLLASATVLGGSFTTGDIVTIEAGCHKQGSNGGWSLGIFWNTTATLNNALLIGHCQDSLGPVNSGFTYSFITRRLQIQTESGSGTVANTGTYVWDVDYKDLSLSYLSHDYFPRAAAGFTYQRVGEVGAWVVNSGAVSGSATNSITWTSDGVIMIAGYVDSSADRVRCEYIKVFGEANGSGIAR